MADQLTPEQLKGYQGMAAMDAEGKLDSVSQGLLREYEKRYNLSAPKPHSGNGPEQSIGRFLSEIGGNIVGGAKTTAQTVLDMGKMGFGSPSMQKEAWENTQNNWLYPSTQIMNNRESSYIDKGLAMVPGVGPFVSNALHKVIPESMGGKGDYVGGLADLATFPVSHYLPGLLKTGLEKTVNPVGKMMYNTSLPAPKTMSPLDRAAFKDLGSQKQIVPGSQGEERAQTVADQALDRVIDHIDRDPFRPASLDASVQPLMDAAEEKAESRYPEMADPYLAQVLKNLKRYNNQLTAQDLKLVADREGIGDIYGAIRIAQKGNPTLAGEYAQNVKQATNKLLDNRAFRKNPSNEGKVDIIRTDLEGQRNALNITYPEIGPDNAEAHNAINLKRSLEDVHTLREYMARPETMATLAGFGGSAYASQMGHPALGGMGMAITILKELFRNPYTASRIGLTLNDMGNGKLGQTILNLPRTGIVNNNADNH